MPKIDSLGDREELFTRLAQQLQEFLIYLEQHPSEMLAYINDPVAFLKKPRINKMLEDRAKAILLSSDYSVVQEIMSYRKSTAIRWICIWII
jgi:hypothetical protein